MVTLVSFGGMPSVGQARWMRGLAGLEYFPTRFKLEWMQHSAADMEASSAHLLAIIRHTKPDLLHFSQYYYGALRCDVPRIVVAHSDVVSWWISVHGQEPPETRWMSWYREVVGRGLAGATAVIAPSQWMLGQVERYHLRPARSAVIHNGRAPALFNPNCAKEWKILTAGRLWDKGKNAGLLLAPDMPAPVHIVGANQAPETRGDRFVVGTGVVIHGSQDEERMSDIFAHAAIYVAPSRYEPFGLAPVEAALSRCALVLSDIPSFRELWDGAAVFFHDNDSQDLKRALEVLAFDSSGCQKYGNLARNHALGKFDSARMTEEYLTLYRALTPAAVATA
jgi:glycosyltransferase involved in cell wall biosynthesis